MRKIGLFLVLLLSISSCMTFMKSSNDLDYEYGILDSTAENLDENYIQTGASRAALANDAVIYLNDLPVEQGELSWEAVGMVSFSYLEYMSPGKQLGKPTKVEIYKLLAPFARSKGANSIVLSDRTMESIDSVNNGLEAVSILKFTLTYDLKYAEYN